MNILEYGSIIICKDITFEDNKYDIKGHPGVVILPTSENQENALCLYMTSKEKRRDRDDYYCIGKGIKKISYVNMNQIVQTSNIKKDIKNYMNEEIFLDLLENFYNYQMNLDVKKETFKQIEGKIKILIEILKRKKILNIDIDDITREELDRLDEIGDIKKAMVLYGTKLLYHFQKDTKEEKKIKIAFFYNQRERNYSNTLLGVYKKIKELSKQKLDENTFNTKISNVYENHYKSVFNKNMLFKDLVVLLELDNHNSILSSKVKRVINTIEEKGENKEMKSTNSFNQFNTDFQER